MSTYTQAKTITDLLLIEVKSGWTKKNAVLKAGAVYPLGTVLALVAVGVYATLDLAGAGAAKKAVAVTAETVDASAADTPGVVIARGAVVASDELVWPAGITEAQKAIALGELEDRGIAVKTAIAI